MKLDVESMMYFVREQLRLSITEQDIIDTAVYSATGKKPTVETAGFKNLRWGKTYRDEGITGYKDMLAGGLVTKAELISDMPENLKSWLWEKIKNFPYNCPTDLFMADINSMDDKEHNEFDNSLASVLKSIVEFRINSPDKDPREMLVGVR